MIKAECNKGDMEISLGGDVIELSADMCTILCRVYNMLYEQNTIQATFFRDCVENAINNNMVFRTELIEEEFNNGND